MYRIYVTSLRNPRLSVPYARLAGPPCQLPILGATIPILVLARAEDGYYPPYTTSLICICGRMSV